MIRGGMSVGSHTHSHEVLGRLSCDQQYEELRLSREILERELGIEVEALAYPVGGRSTFSEETYGALKRAGYRLAFSFYGGVNGFKEIDPFDVRRNGVESDLTYERFRFQTSLAAMTGRGWV